MEYIQISTSQQNQTIRLFDSRPIDLEGSFTLDTNGKLLELMVGVKNQYNNKSELKSCYIFDEAIDGNKLFKFLIINLYEGSTSNPQQPPVKANIEKDFVITKGLTIHVHTNFYDSTGKEIDFTGFNIYKFKFDPGRKKGNILVGG